MQRYEIMCYLTSTGDRFMIAPELSGVSVVSRPQIMSVLTQDGLRAGVEMKRIKQCDVSVIRLLFVR